jgi:NADH-quinone oxidoreductase subunit N
LEVFSISGYALAGLKRGDDRSAEAAVKYFLTGSFASAFFIFGLALIFGGIRTLDVSRLGAALTESGSTPVLFFAGLALAIGGLAYKIALVPFHMYQPDVYEGSPTPVSAFFAVAPKAAGFAVLLRLLLPSAGTGEEMKIVFSLLAAVAAATMVLANFAALRQTNLKRILAYSSLAHAGYMSVAVVAQDPAGLLFYLTQYLFPGLGAFAVIIALGGPGREALELDDLTGLGRRYPWLGGIFAILLVSLAGFPPTSGFLAKFYIFSSAVRAGHLGLALVGVATSLVSVYYYFRIIRVMFMKEAEGNVEADADNPAVYLVLFLCLYAVLQLGLFPGNIVTLIGRAAASF